MTKPQQPELRRSGKGSTDADSAKAIPEVQDATEDAGIGPVPEDNLPGHHPEQDQDKPEGVPEPYRRPDSP